MPHDIEGKRDFRPAMVQHGGHKANTITKTKLVAETMYVKVRSMHNFIKAKSPSVDAAKVITLQSKVGQDSLH